VDFTAKGIYELWRTAGDSSPKWEDLTQGEREHWAAFCMKLRDQVRSMAGRR